VAGAYGVALASRRAAAASHDRAAFDAAVSEAAARLVATRPTAVNLGWAVQRMLAAARGTHGSPADVAAVLEREALAVHADDRAMCDAIGRHGAPLLPDGAVVLTHCNAGALATGGIGTALAPVYVAHAEGRRVAVVADETRPLLQGSRLTAWELARAGIGVTVITDGMAASRLRRGDVTCVLVGADRIAANGDTANKIGTAGLAIVARALGVPFYVAAPRSTFDPALPDGGQMPIEERAPGEVTRWGTRPTAPDGVGAWNPAFDVTPAELITGFITERGLLAVAALRRAMTSP
jgi:methylthioribose-1-phosphate isomerase